MWYVNAFIWGFAAGAWSMLGLLTYVSRHRD